MIPLLQPDGPRKVYPPVWKCIYCGDDKSELEIEHIVPVGLGGNWELPEASCRKCADLINKQIEQVCLQQLMGPIRYKLGLRPRKGNERLELFPVTMITPAGEKRTVSVPIEEYPDSLTVPIFSPPGILTGAAPTNLVEQKYAVRVNTEAFMRFAEKYGKPDPHVDLPLGKTNEHTFSRMLAKIAHCYAVAEFGLGNFEPLVIDLIFGKTETSPYWVGGRDEKIPPFAKDIHKLDLSKGTFDGVEYLLVDLWLLCPFQIPVYRVVVGRLKGS